MADIIQIINEPLLIEVWQGNDWTTITYGEDVTVYGNLSFLSLCDTPDSYKGQAGKTPIVNEDENGLIFESVIGRTFTNLKDCPNSYENNSNKLVKVKEDESGLEFVNIIQDFTVIPFIKLADVPANYNDASNKVVQVCTAENGLQFSDINDVLPKLITHPGRYSYATLTVDAQGRITSIESSKPGTVLPEYDDNHLLIGNGTDIPVPFENGKLHQFITVVEKQVEDQKVLYPSWAYINQMYNSRGLLAVDCTNDGSSAYYVQIHSAHNGISIVPRSTNSEENININIIPQSRGSIVLGNNATEAVYLGTTLNVQNSTITANGTLTLMPKGLGTIRVNSSLLTMASYTDNIVDINDLTNKGYVDKAISDAISGVSGTKGIKVTNPTDISYTNSQVVLGSIPANSIIEEIRISVNEIFSDDIYITIGNDLDNDLLLDKTYLNRKGCWHIDTYVKITSESTIKVYLNENIGSVGRATIYLKYF